MSSTQPTISTGESTEPISRQQIVECARSWIGTPYHHQGRKKGVGVDCAGLILGVAKELGLPYYDYPGYSRYADGVDLLAAFSDHCPVVPVAHRLPGDLLLFRVRRVPAHCGILTGQDLVCHAYSTLGEVKEHPLGHWESRIYAVFRYPGL